MSELDTSDEDDEDDLDTFVTQVATRSRTPSPATNTSDNESMPSLHMGSPSFASPTYEFPSCSFSATSATSSPRLPSRTLKRRRSAGDQKSVQFDLSANIEYPSGSTLHLIGRQDPCALLRRSIKPVSILVRRPGDNPPPAPVAYSQSSQSSIFSQPFCIFTGDRPSPSTTPSPSPELQLSPLIPHTPEFKTSMPAPAVSAAASAMAQSLGSLFASSSPIFLQPRAPTFSVELNGERYSVPAESSSQPLPSHSTLFDELGYTSDHETDDIPSTGVTAQKRLSPRPSSPPKRLRTDPSIRRRGDLPAASRMTSNAPSPRRMPAMLRREASYGSGLQRSSNSSSLDLSAFFDGQQEQNRQLSPLRNEITQDSDDHHMTL
ncbi:hypothetical protein BGZ73_001236 [Actinomortierella ambigua]|nr:hypothetical protein BGZ73_001236 [Actinomortierella ambigua]